MDDIHAECDRLKAASVAFVREPAQAHGGWDAGFDDGCGNIINLHQEAW